MYSLTANIYIQIIRRRSLISCYISSVEYIILLYGVSHDKNKVHIRKTDVSLYKHERRYDGNWYYVFRLSLRNEDPDCIT